MAEALKCDRCGCLYESYTPEAPKKAKGGAVNKFFDLDTSAYLFSSLSPLTGRYQGYNSVLRGVLLDLCPKCRESFIEWFNSPESK